MINLSYKWYEKIMIVIILLIFVFVLLDFKIASAHEVMLNVYYDACNANSTIDGIDEKWYYNIGTGRC